MIQGEYALTGAEVAARWQETETKQWEHAITSSSNNVMLFGVNVFDYKWQCTGERAIVRDTLNQKYRYWDVYKIEVDGKEHEFATGEFSNCVWGFYIPK